MATSCFYCGDKIYGHALLMFGRPICNAGCVTIDEALKKHRDHVKMADLTKNTTAFGLMDEADREALRALQIDQVEFFCGNRWVAKPSHSPYSTTATYRQKLEPPKPVVETRKGGCWGATFADWCPALYDERVTKGVHGTYHQTVIDGKPVRITWVADGHTPELTDEQAREVAKILLDKDNLNKSDPAISWVKQYFAAFVKAGVM